MQVVEDAPEDDFGDLSKTKLPLKLLGTAASTNVEFSRASVENQKSRASVVVHVGYKFDDLKRVRVKGIVSGPRGSRTDAARNRCGVLGSFVRFVAGRRARQRYVRVWHMTSIPRILKCCFRAAACLFWGGQVGGRAGGVAWGVGDGSWRASGPRAHCAAASAATRRLPPAATPPIAGRLQPVPLDTACDLLGLPDRPPPRLRACVPIADRRPPTAARRAPPAASDLPARRPACLPACLPAARRRGQWWSLRGLCWVPRMTGGDAGGLGWCARRRPRVW